MYVICISTNFEDYVLSTMNEYSYSKESNKSGIILGLTLNKKYEVTWSDTKWYEIINDDGFKTFYDRKNFINLGQWRDKIITEILSD